MQCIIEGWKQKQWLLSMDGHSESETKTKQNSFSKEKLISKYLTVATGVYHTFWGTPPETVRNIQPCISQQRETHSVLPASAARTTPGRKHWETSQALGLPSTHPLIFRHFLFL